MLNQSGVTTVNATTPKSILWAPETAVAVPCVVDNTGITAGSDGKKMLMAGTPLSGDLTARNTAFKKAATSGEPAASNAVGLLLHTVDVTNGKQNATVLVSGLVDLNKLDNATAALITAEVKAALPRITFVK